MTQVLETFLTRSFAPDETIALLLRGANPVRIQQRIVPLERVLEPSYKAWLSYQNRTGVNIHVAANPLLPQSRRRTKDAVASIRHLYLDLDSEGDKKLGLIRESSCVPTPNLVLATSSGKYQVLWRVTGFDRDLQEPTLKSLSLLFGGDPACTDCNRVLRAPGFVNWKYTSMPLVTIEYLSESVASPSDFRLPLPEVAATPIPLQAKERRRTLGSSRSESDWAWICDQIARGKDAGELTHELMLRRADKSDPLYYAQRTVDVACARFWLAQGTATDCVISRLEGLRRAEVPPSLCASRAREIAATAMRMITRKLSN